MSDKPGAPRAQAASPQNIVTDLRSRDQWMIAFNEAASGLDVSAFKVSLAFTVALGNRIALHHNCKSCRCDPGYPALAKEMGVSLRTAMRGVAALEATGWLKRKRGGRDDKVSFTLCWPHVTELANPNLIPDNMLSPMEMRPYVTKSAFIGDTQGGRTKEQRNRDRSAPKAARASGLVDREEQAFQELIEMRPLTHPHQVETARAAFAALLKTTRIDDILDEALTIEENPTDAVLFLTNLASDRTGGCQH